MTGSDPKVTKELALSHGLTAEEYDRIIRRLGREPRFTELGLFSALWSEHCAYKHSRVFLRDLPTKGPQVLQGPGENAGIVDLGGGLALTFKIESHNHPSFIEPFQGAATGVGGILRDIFTMGARPIAILDSLRFAPPDDARARRLLEGVTTLTDVRDAFSTTQPSLLAQGNPMAADRSSSRAVIVHRRDRCW